MSMHKDTLALDDLTVNRSECTDPLIVRAVENDLNTADKL